MKFSMKCPKDWEKFAEYLGGVNETEEYSIEIKKVRDTRTDQQRKAIELYCKLLAEALNDAGFSYTSFIRVINSNGVQVPWTQERAKEAWRMVQVAMTKKESTTKLDSKEVSQIYDVVNAKFIEMTNGASVPFPDRWHGLVHGE